MNGLADQGAILIGKALGANQTLEELNLTANRIHDLGVLGIAKGLERNDTLHTLQVHVHE